MKLTAEQEEIIRSTGDIRINAVAGSGKTTTIIEYARARPVNSRILYLAFNRTVKNEAERKFSGAGLKNVKVDTAHSLAYRHIVFKNKYKVRSNGYRTNEIADLLKLSGNGEKHAEYILANHILKFLTYFCNSACRKVQELNYLDTITDAKARIFVSSFYKQIEKQARILLAKMDSGEIEIMHDFYLKKFQLSDPELPYNYILFDEGQDASPAMLDVFLRQQATKVIVGDTHQQIYGWRHAVNSLEKVNFKTFTLSASFRFNQHIADLAIKILEWKKLFRQHTETNISGLGNDNEQKVKAILARTNLGLLLKAIEFISDHKHSKDIYFEGNINSYTYADDGASLYDVLNLFNCKYHSIKDNLIKGMKSMAELDEYVKKTEDLQLGMMVEVVKKYGNRLPQIIREIKSRHVDDGNRHKARMIFSTVHRCKGMEYDIVELADDFITETKLRKQLNDNESKPELSKLAEEINLLYVAVTRTKNFIHIPVSLVPEGFPGCEKILLLEKTDVEELFIPGKKFNYSARLHDGFLDDPEVKKWSVDKARKANKKAYSAWNEQLDIQLTEMYCKGDSIEKMMEFFGRSKGSITSRIRKLELYDLYG